MTVLALTFLPEYENQGFGFEAATALKEKALTEFGLSKLVAITLIENTNSQRLLYKLGFARKGTVRLPASENDFYLFTTKNYERERLEVCFVYSLIFIYFFIWLVSNFRFCFLFQLF